MMGFLLKIVDVRVGVLMKKFLSVFILAILVSCTSAPLKKDIADQSDVIKNDPMFIKTDCEQNHDALSCAKFAYKLKNSDPDLYLKYTSLACDLGDQSSCFNLGQLKGKVFDYNLTVLKREEGQIFSCYAYHSEDVKTSEVKMGEKEHKVLNLSALIDQSGKLQKMTLDGRNLNAQMERCIQGIYHSKKFVGADKDMLLSLTLLMPVQYKEKDVAKNSLDGLADSLKDLN
jgi:hypothetical protein